MSTSLSELGLTGLLKALVRLGVNVTGKQYEYLKWRLSDEGKKYFDQEQDNRFYEALEKGDTTVMDLEIKERQKEIDGLLDELGPLCVLIGFLLLAGCSAVTIPKDRMLAHPGSLLTSEKSYVVEDMKVRTPEGENVTLNGRWHVVSPEFIKVHRSNQDNLLKALKAVKKGRRNFAWLLGGATVTVILALIVGFKLGTGGKH